MTKEVEHKDPRTVSDILVENLPDKGHKSTSGQKLFFDKDFIAEKFADLFELPQASREKFYEAFRIVTQGQGSELLKVNSVISSSLLSLLVFYPLFGNKDESVHIEIDGVRYTRCLFEIKNRVIRFPSCVDVVLVSDDGKKLLFLESKFTEYATSHSASMTYGKSYIPLYRELIKNQLLAGLVLGERTDKLVLKDKDNERQYIDGIKQCISHLVGIVRGPQYRAQGCYPPEYHADYERLYKNASELIFGTILYDPTHLETVETGHYEAYKKYYRSIIGENGEEILSVIRGWDKENDLHDNDNDKEKTIRILPHPETYQNIFEGNNRNLLQGKVAEFYRLK